MSRKELLLCATADEGSRTLVSSLEGWGNSRYTTSAKNMKLLYRKTPNMSIGIFIFYTVDSGIYRSLPYKRHLKRLFPVF